MAAIHFDSTDRASEIIEMVMNEAILQSASDVHFSPGASSVDLRFRVDGVLHTTSIISKEQHLELVARIKVLAGLRIDMHYMPHDGRFRYCHKDDVFDVRVSIVPALHGENAVLRLLRNTIDNISLQSLGFDQEDIQKITKCLERSSGMILATGPTGSGKTTTLYSLLMDLPRTQKSIITLEDPVEYAINGITQLQVNDRLGFTFSTGLRSILRQDPDIIMVGEIRDKETAGIAVGAALTGHLLFSTLHTSDAATALTRLVDMQVENYLIASTVNIVIAQRLVRKICSHCRVQKRLQEKEIESLNPYLEDGALTEVSYGAGCDQCNQTGFRGRVSVNEVLLLDAEMQEALLAKPHARIIASLARRRGMKSISRNGFDKVRTGVTTVEEVFRVLHE